MLAGDGAWRADPPPLRVDGVRIVDTPKTIAEGKTTLLEVFDEP
jgi:hypothetical protein